MAKMAWALEEENSPSELLVPSGSKQTDVGVIPEDWNVEACAGACVKVQDGTHFSPSVGGNDFLYLTSKNIGYGYIDVSDAYWIDADQHRSIYKRCDVRNGDLLLTKDGVNTGNAALNNLENEFSLLSSVAFLRFDPRKHVSGYFLQQILSHAGQQRIKEAMAGNAITRLTLEKIRKLLFPVAPFPEQRAIAEALSDADTYIESLEQLIAKKRHLKQGAMHELLTGKTRLPGFNGEWEMKRLGRLANVQRGASPRPIDSAVWFDENSPIGWVRISDLTKSRMYLFETTQRLSPLGVQNSRPVARGSLIMSICATVGRPIITEIDTCIHDGFVVFDNIQATKLFVYYVLKSIEGDWSRHGQTGSQMNLNTGLINRTEVLVPPTTEEQTAIAAVLSDMDAEIFALETKLTKVRQIKQGMMQELLTGRVRLI